MLKITNVVTIWNLEVKSENMIFMRLKIIENMDKNISLNCTIINL
jgi:hypothetical protein